MYDMCIQLAYYLPPYPSFILMRPITITLSLFYLSLSLYVCMYVACLHA